MKSNNTKKTYNINYLHDNFNLELIEEDFGLNGLDYAKGLSIEELDEEFEDYKKEL